MYSEVDGLPVQNNTLKHCRFTKSTSPTPQEADRLQREITATDAAIDQLVYDLYGLTEEEIKIVEG